MFCLRIQSVDFPAGPATAVADEVDPSGGGGGTTSKVLSPRSSHPITSPTSSSLTPLELSGATSAAPARSPTIHHTCGIIHLYRSCPTISSSSYASAVAATSSSSGLPAPPRACNSLLPPWRDTCLLVLAVRSRFSTDNLFTHTNTFWFPYSKLQTLLCSLSNLFTHTVAFRDDGVEYRYSVLVEFEDQKNADRFYLSLNGWRFSSSEREVCHALFPCSVQYTTSAEIASSLPTGSIELPTCPICIDRLRQDISGILATTCDHAFQCSCISVWLNSSCLVCQFCQKQSENPTCSVCQVTGNLWICVICGFVGCGRYNEGHAKQHWRGTSHCYSLDLETQRIWDYVGGSYAID